ncbi:peptidoglycan DD-metalloendopeptidase family protein [Bacillus sp. V59.32b]|uniref:peptidoglycan DD-metalloendopeptidase family protein n=1 Tax=Bacillus sp. V59.32b TaxID=1758642 RepID=UPI000E3EC78C|nr:peptidoglycan DD-metalloendopeptidase family protein [Bacillus sp. V59.32b]RFU69059.1 LysM peptidoglycan-binding domain-containing protein [Bacillus sp. V59.32b]
MIDYGKRFLIVIILAMCIGLLFVGGKTGHASAAGKEDWLWPAADGIISDRFGTRDGSHKGIDIAAKLNTNIIAADEGVVSKSYYSDSYGNVVFIKHPNGFETIYAHLNKRLVSEGKSVRQGEVIGKMGNTGRSRGVHLHFEVHEQEWTVDKRHALDPLLVMNQSPKQRNISEQESIHVTKQVEDKAVAAVKGTTHTVKKGETLWSIAKRNGTTVEAVKKLNHLQSDFIKSGDSLILSK